MSTPTPTLTPLPLLITEVFPKPSQGEEWVELYNPHSTTIVLAGWELWDELSQPSLIFSFTTQTIDSNQWLIVPINRKLNDTADGVVLKNPSGNISDSMHYASSETDLSWARTTLNHQANWQLSLSSPGLANPSPTVTPSPTPTTLPTPTNTQTPSTTLAPTKTPTQTVTVTQTYVSNSPTQLTASSMQVINPTPTTPLPTPSLSPTPSLVPTLSLEKPSQTPSNSTNSAKLPPLYFLGLTLIQLSTIGMNYKKHGMIQPNALAQTT